MSTQVPDVWAALMPHVVLTPISLAVLAIAVTLVVLLVATDSGLKLLDMLHNDSVTRQKNKRFEARLKRERDNDEYREWKRSRSEKHRKDDF